MVYFSFYFTTEEDGFPVLITAEEPIFITEEPIPVKEFINMLMGLVNLRTVSTDIFGLKIMKNGEYVKIRLPDGRNIQVSAGEFTKNVQHTIENIRRILQKRPVKVEHLKFRLLRPEEFWSEGDESYLNEYDIEIYGDVYVLNATINLRDYLDDLGGLKEFIEEGKLPKEKWRVVWDIAQLKQGLEKALPTLVKSADCVSPPFVRFNLGTYDPLEIVYVSNLGDRAALFFVAWAKIAIKVPKEVLLMALNDAIRDAEKELERLKLSGW